MWRCSAQFSDNSQMQKAYVRIYASWPTVQGLDKSCSISWELKWVSWALLDKTGWHRHRLGSLILVLCCTAAKPRLQLLNRKKTHSSQFLELTHTFSTHLSVFLSSSIHLHLTPPPFPSNLLCFSQKPYFPLPTVLPYLFFFFYFFLYGMSVEGVRVYCRQMLSVHTWRTIQAAVSETKVTKDNCLRHKHLRHKHNILGRGRKLSTKNPHRGKRVAIYFIGNYSR